MDASLESTWIALPRIYNEISWNPLGGVSVRCCRFHLYTRQSTLPSQLTAAKQCRFYARQTNGNGWRGRGCHSHFLNSHNWPWDYFQATIITKPVTYFFWIEVEIVGTSYANSSSNAFFSLWLVASSEFRSSEIWTRISITIWYHYQHSHAPIKCNSIDKLTQIDLMEHVWPNRQ